MKKILILLSLVFLYISVQGQHRPTGEFMQSNGFTSAGDGVWKNADGATVEMDGDNVKGFTAPQKHAWEMVFGDGSTLGYTVKVKPGDVITFKDGVIKFANGVQFKLLSAQQPVCVSRGIVKSAFFNKERTTLSPKDIKIVKGESYSPGWLNISGKENDEKAIDEYGNIVEKVLAAEAAERVRRAKINIDYEQAKEDYKEERQEYAIAEYEAYCKKYGKDKIDKTLNGDIVVGVPWELTAKVIKHLSLYNYKERSAGQYLTEYSVYYILREPRKWNEYFRVWVDNETGLIHSWVKSQYFYVP